MASPLDGSSPAADLSQYSFGDADSKSGRRRTILVYSSPAAEAPSGAGADGSLPKEKLATHKNLMYSDREAELIEDLTRFLIEKQPTVIKELFNRTDKNDENTLAECFVSLSYSSGAVFPLIQYFIGDEFMSGGIAGALMRENVIASKLIKAYIQKFGAQYLVDTLGKLISQIVINERKVNYEINPTKLEAEEVEKNREALEKKLEQVLKHLTSKETLEKMPPGIRVIAKTIAEFAAKTNNDVHILIGSFVFLRYINPAISSPEGFGVLPPGKVPTNNTRRNLTLITKVLQNLANGKTFNNKEVYMIPLNGFVEKHFKTVQTYFDEVVNFAAQFKTIHAGFAEVSVNHLHTFHSLIFQHRDKMLSAFTNEADAAEFNKAMERLGSYDKKVTFSFLPDAEQKLVKQIMSSRNDEASFVGYIEMMQSKKSKGKNEKHILIIGLYRIIWATLSGKVAKEAHLIDLRGISSSDPKSLTLQFKEFELVQTADDVDMIIDSIRRAFDFTFHSMPASIKPKVSMTPASRMQYQPSTTDDPCDGIVATYRSLCDFYDTKPNEEVCWDLENLYLNSRAFHLKKFTAYYLDPLRDKDALPLFHALAYNNYFTTLSIKHFKFSPSTFQGVIETISNSSSIEDITLSDVQLSEKQNECWLAFFEAMVKNDALPLRAIDLSNTPMEDRCIVPLGLFFKKYPRGMTKIDLTNTCGDKAAKGTGFLGIFEGLCSNRAINQELSVLKVGKNKLPTLEPPLTKAVNAASQLTELDVSSTSLDVNKLGLVGKNDQLRSLNLSGNKMAKPEQWVGLIKFLETPGCRMSELNISNTSVPIPTLKDLLTKLHPDINIFINASNNAFGFQGAQMLGSIGAQIACVSNLDVSDNNFGDDGLIIVIEGFFNCSSIVTLNLNRNFSKEAPGKVRDKLVQTLIQLINQTSCPLESLHIAGTTNCKLKASIVPFIQALGVNTSLTEIDISGHGFGDKGAIALAKTLEINHVLNSVIWDDNNTGLIGLTNVNHSITTNQNLKSIPLPWKDIVRVMNMDGIDKSIVSQLIDKMTQSITHNNMVV